MAGRPRTPGDQHAGQVAHPHWIAVVETRSLETLAATATKLVNESLELLVVRNQPQQLLGVSERGGRIAGLPAEVDERNEGVAVLGVSGLALLQDGHGL